MGGSARRAGIRARRRIGPSFGTGASGVAPGVLARPFCRHRRQPRSPCPHEAGRTREVFTGIVEELGEITAVENLGDACRFRLRGPVVTEGAKHGDSIAVNGVCLTVVDHDGDEFTAAGMAETLPRSRLGALAAG